MGEPTEKSTKKAKAAKKQIIPIDDAKPSDLCSNLELCQKQDECNKYHPMWAIGICIYYLKDKCKNKECKRIHESWENLESRALTNFCFDIFNKKPMIFKMLIK